jgi:hypothetical protein
VSEKAVSAINTIQVFVWGVGGQNQRQAGLRLGLSLRLYHLLNPSLFHDTLRLPTYHAMPITFGSVGDIISVCLLVKDLVDALDKARGSKAEYQSLIRELWLLDRTLLEIDLLTRIHGGGATPELEALCKTARKAVDRCRELVSAFSTRVQKYQKSLGENATPAFIKATTMKMRWCIGEKDTVDTLRAEIAATSASLQMLLATASV